MKNLYLSVFILVSGLYASADAMAQVGVTDDCQQDIKELRDEIERDKDLYTVDSRTKANAELTMAQTNRLNPVKCRKNIQDARAALRKGKKAKKDKG